MFSYSFKSFLKHFSSPLINHKIHNEMIHLTLFAVATDMISNVYFLKINKFQGELCDHKGTFVTADLAL